MNPRRALQASLSESPPPAPRPLPVLIRRAVALGALSVCGAVGLLTGCASYQALPLPTRTDLAPDASHVRIDLGTLPTPTMRSHRFDPSDGLDMTEVAMIAVVNSPELQALRADAGVARAQAFAAGLLPDPQLALTRESVLGTPPGTTIAMTAGLSFDIGALLMQSSLREARRDEHDKSDLNLLWQEWQTVAKARLLFVKITAAERSAALLATQQATLASRVDRLRTAAARGLVAQDLVVPQLSALQDVDRQRHDLDRQLNQSRHDLNALLGLAPDVTLSLVGSSTLEAPDADLVNAALAQAPRRRPDLLALQAGYQAEDARYRGALRAQFPAITLGPTRGRDTGGVNTVGLSLGLTLPLFNRNRGNIAIELATREKLRLEYQQRLNSTASDAHRLLAEDALLRDQRQHTDAALGDLSAAAQRARQAFTAREIDALVLATAESALLAKQLELIALDQALQEQAIALQALVGDDLLLPTSPSSDTKFPS